MKPERVAAHITAWLHRYCTEAGTNGFVVGVSGGVDSALTSTLAARTGLRTLCIELPIHQNPDQVKRAQEHVRWLQQHYKAVELRSAELTHVFDAFVNALGTSHHPNREMALVNARARLRMTALYYYAGLHGLLVAGTGNRVEDYGIGFFTKYGDGGVDLSPIADLTKTQVYEISHHLGISKTILEAPPTDGLWGDNRTDEDQIGASYPELEWAMEFNGAESKLDSRQRQVLDIYRKLNRANQHKMKSVPVCKIPKEMLDG